MIWHNTNVADVISHFEVDDKKGLANGEVEIRLEKYGENIVSKIKKPSFLSHFIGQFNNKIVIFLIVIALVSFFVSMAYNELNGYYSLLIIGVVIANALISAYNVYKCSENMETIKKLTNPTVNVLRDGVIQSVNSVYLVPGDIVLLEEGDFITADGRIIECNEFRCNEMVLTGAEIPIEKNSDDIHDEITVLEKRTNMVFSGCSVAHGNAKYIVTSTGLDSEIGKTSAISQQIGEDEIPIQKQLDAIGKIANIAILFVCIIVFLISLVQNFSSQNFASMTVKVLVDTVALAVAAIPEGLPTIAAIVISLGIQRIIKDDIIIKDTSAVELLGKTEILCCDKTGILTRNTMVLTKVFDGNEILDLESNAPSDSACTVIKLATACSTLSNDSTEDAIEKACLAYNSMSMVDVSNIFPQVSKIPFNSDRKTMSVITMMNSSPFAIIKGAAESIVPKCNNCKVEEILKLNDQLAEDGLRIVAVAIRQLDELTANPTADEIEQDLTFVGLLALEDPPREGITADIETLETAGIRTIMITGDNLITAKKIAEKIGILKDGNLAITGAELDELSDYELAENISKYSVFARVSPSHKLRIVKAWQSHKKRVTITGDNLSDTESLATADVGCAVGKYGADVAKGNADIIIANNRFHSVLKAIRESRGLFGNIRKSIFYLFSCNFAEILVVVFGLLMFKNMPVAAVQLLWINLLTDCAPAISLSLEKGEKDVMKNHSTLVSRIFDLKSGILICLQSIYICVITLIAYAGGNDFGDTATSSTMAFTVLGLAQIFHCYNCKYEGTVFGKNLFSNRFMNLSIIITIFVMVFLLFTDAGFVFGLVSLTKNQFISCFMLSVSVIPVVEILKVLLNFIFKKIEHR